MRPHHLWIAGIVALAGLCLVPVTSFAASGETPAGNYKVIYTFTGTPDGAVPVSDLTFDAEGNLYGTTVGGGTYGYGTVFELKHTGGGWEEEVLYSFTGGSDGGYPEAGVIFDSQGSLYGTTSGATTCGNVFMLTPNSHGGWAESVLYTFTCGDDGASPQTDLTFDAKGNLFGANLGGSLRFGCGRTCGSVFELVPQAKGAWKEVTLYTFDGPPNGGLPSSPVALDSSGNVWGTATAGGTGSCHSSLYTGGCGIVYELTPSSGGNWTETVVYNFVRGGGNAVTPSGGFALENDGNILITSLAGGDGLGAVFELKRSKQGWEQEVLYSFYGSYFHGPDGDQPVGRLETDLAGALLGVTQYVGKNGLGTLFELEPSKTTGWTEKVLHSFAGGSNGSYPEAGLSSDSQGHLYGTTSGGGNTGGACGSYGCGIVYEITPGGQ